MRAQQNQSPVCHKNLSARARTRVMWYFTKLHLRVTVDSSAYVIIVLAFTATYLQEHILNFQSIAKLAGAV